jgi:hypothetical protein
MDDAIICVYIYIFIPLNTFSLNLNQEHRSCTCNVDQYSTAQRLFLKEYGFIHKEIVVKNALLNAICTLFCSFSLNW